MDVFRKTGKQKKLCPICFTPFTDQVIGSPNNCDHLFCIDCILKWSKTNSDCPVDRNPFDRVKVSHKGKHFAEMKVAEIKKRKITERYDFTTLCEKCDSGDRDKLILCDACNLAFHTYCLKPSLRTIPKDQWYCPDCCLVLNRKSKKSKEAFHKYMSKADGLREQANLRNIIKEEYNVETTFPKSSSSDNSMPKNEPDNQMEVRDTQLNPGGTELNPEDTELNQGDTELNPGDTELNPEDTELNQGDTELNPSFLRIPLLSSIQSSIEITKDGKFVYKEKK